MFLIIHEKNIGGVCVSKVYIYLGTYEYLIIIISLLFRKDYNVTANTIS